MNESWQHFLELLWGMTEKELRARYKYTVFGFLWLVINPILQMLVIGFIFTFFIDEPIPNYYLYLFTGLLTWNFFSLSLTKATPSIIHERSLIKKAAFPRTVIPLSIILSNLIHFLLAIFLLTAATIIVGTTYLDRLPSIFLGFILLGTFTIGISLLTTALNVRFRDINFFTQALLVIWFYATPIVYTLNKVPYDYYWLWRINPMTSIVQLFQFGFTGSAAPGPLMIAANTLIILVIFFLGWRVFTSESKNFDDWV